MPADTNFYMAAINLTGKRCLVVGGGPIAIEKIESLLLCNAIVRVVAPDPDPQLAVLRDAGKVELTQRRYDQADLEGCFLVIAATSDRTVNTRVYEDADARSMLVNVVDVPDLCNFIVPAVARVGPIGMAITTSGASPALAKRIKREIAELIGSEYAELALLLSEVRDWARVNLPTYSDRKDFFERIVNGTPDPVILLKGGERERVRQLIADAQRRAEEQLRGRTA